MPGPVIFHVPTDINEIHTDIYGDIKDTTQTVPNAVAGGNVAPVELRSVIHLSLCDSLPAHGPIVDMTFALARNGVCTLIFTLTLTALSLFPLLILFLTSPMLFVSDRIVLSLSWWRRQVAVDWAVLLFSKYVF